MRRSGWLWVVAAFVALAGEARAHGGGLDANGCHHNRKTGDYHCHRGGPRLMAPRPPAKARQSPGRPAGAAAPARKPVPSLYGTAGTVIPCYCHGHSGYRENASGKCVSIANIIKVCGIPPEGKCRFEGGAAEGGAGACPK